MTTRSRPGQIAIQALVTIVVATVLVGVTTLARAALGPSLGGLSPFMLYVAAVLVAGLVRGVGCGALVMLFGGLVGYRLFLASDGAAPAGSMIALWIFWAVSAAVLVTANELRVQLSRAMTRLSAAIERHGNVAP